MFNRKIIKNLRSLRKKPVNGEFLSAFRIKLESYMEKNPILPGVLLEERQRAWFPEKLRLVQASFAAVLMVIISGAGLTFASQKSLPGGKLYPVKILSEEIVVKLTPKTETKAKLRAEFANRRVKEIEEVIKSGGANPLAINIGLSEAERNFSRVAAMVDEEKSKGKDVKKLAKTVSDDMEKGVSDLKNVFGEQKKNLKAREKKLRTEIKEAQRSAKSAGSVAGPSISANAPIIERFKKELETVKSSREIFEVKKDEMENSFADEKKWIDEQIGIKESAQKAIRNAEVEKADVLSEGKYENISLDANVFKKFEELIKEAKADFESGDFYKARKNANLAGDSLVEAKKIIKESEAANLENNNSVSGDGNGSGNGDSGSNSGSNGGGDNGSGGNGGNGD